MIAGAKSLAVVILSCCLLVSSCGGAKRAEPAEVEIQWPDAGSAATHREPAKGPGAPAEPDAMPAAR
jgi:hypothetical protein